jgi:hypothetical protein
LLYQIKAIWQFYYAIIPIIGIPTFTVNQALFMFNILQYIYWPILNKSIITYG